MKKRIASVVAVLFVFGLALASYGHCWRMLPAQMHHLLASDTHDHHEHPFSGDHSSPELAMPGVTFAPATLPPPSESEFRALPAAPVYLSLVVSPRRLRARARAGPPAFYDAFSRTGRLLI